VIVHINRIWMFCVLSAVLAASSSLCAQNESESPPPSPPPSPAETATATPPVPRAFDSPRSTIRSFLDAISDDPADFGAATATMDLTGIPDGAANKLAAQLLGVVNRVERIHEFSYPAASQIVDEATWRLFPRDSRGSAETMRRHERLASLLPPGDAITLERIDDGRWLFSSETVGVIESMYEVLEREPTLNRWLPDEKTLTVSFLLESLLPPWAGNKFILLEVWQWIGLLVLIFAGIVLDFSLRMILRRVCRRAIRRRGGTAQPETLRRTVRPFGLAAMALLWLYCIRVLGLDIVVLSVLMPAVQFFVMLAGVWAMYRVTDLVGEVFASRAERTDTKFDDLLVPLVRKTIKVFITVFGFIYIADSLNVSIVPLLTGLGIGGVGFEHLFGSVTVIADRPFHVGDWVVIGDVEGTVEEVGFRSTKVRTFYNSQVSIPNGNLVRAVVDNYGKRKYRRWTTHLNITYDTPPDKIEAFCEGLREIIRLHPYTRKDYYQVWLHKFGPHSLDVLLYMFFQTPDWNTELRERHRLMMDILRLADRLGVAMAFPTQTLHLHQEPEGSTHEAAAPPDVDEERRARAIGRRAVRALVANADWRHEKPPPYEFDYAEPLASPEDVETQIDRTSDGSAGE